MKPEPLTKEKRFTAKDMIGVHPVELVRKEDGTLVYVEDVASAVAWFKERMNQSEKMILDYQFKEVMDLIDEAFSGALED